MLNALMSFVQVYLSLFVLGLGWSYWLTQQYTCQNTFVWLLSPLIGYALLANLSVYPLSIPLDYPWLPILFWSLFGLSILMTGLFYFFRNPPNKKDSKFLLIFLAFITLILWLNLNNYQNGYLFHHLNPDITAYLESADWILMHGNLNATQPNSYEVLTNALRWGFPASLAITSSILHVPIYQIIFPMVLIIFTHSIFFTALLISQTYELKNKYMPHIIAGATLFNGSLLYFLSEGFYPYIIGVSYFSMTAALCQFHATKPIHNQTIILVAFFVASVISTCSEFFCLALVFLIGTLFLQVIKKEKFKPTLLFLFAFVLGTFFIFPLSYKILSFFIRNAQNSGHIGYLQPNWVWPSEIIGLKNIYAQSLKYLHETDAIHRVHRSIFNILSSTCLSLWVLYELIRWRKNTFFLVTALGIAGIFLFNRFLISQGHFDPYNYFYDKLSIAFSPLLIGFFFLSLQRSVTYKKIKIFFALSLIIFSGCTFFIDQKHSESFLDIRSLKTIQAAFPKAYFITDSRGLRNQKIVGQLRYIDRATDFLIGYVLNEKTIDPWQWECPETSKIHQQTSSPAVYFIANKQHFPLLLNDSLIKEHQYLLDTRTYYVFDTHFTVAELENHHKETQLKKLYAQFHEPF